jgi:hypothetical protein
VANRTSLDSADDSAVDGTPEAVLLLVREERGGALNKKRHAGDGSGVAQMVREEGRRR